MEDLQWYMQGKEVNVLIVLQTYNYIDNWERKKCKKTQLKMQGCFSCLNLIKLLEIVIKTQLNT
jgi:hypothetical protein